MRDISKKILVGVAFQTILPGLAFFVSHQRAEAWGTSGHRAVAEVAARSLSPQIKQVISPFLGKDNLPTAALWADQVKNIQNWNHTKSYHFESIGDSEDYLGSLEANSQLAIDQGGAIMAVLESENVLSSGASTFDQKANALRFLVHFVGDLHQPLHSGRPEDRGGNDIDRKWSGKKTNLHAIWDSSIVEAAYPQFMTATKAGKFLDEKKYADYLYNQYGKIPVSGEEDLNLWMLESLRIRPQIYQTAQAPEDQIQKQFLRTIDFAIYKAGIRLGLIITRIFKAEAESAFQLSFKQSIESILGPIMDIICLNPKQRANSSISQNSENEKDSSTQIGADFF